VVRPPLGYDWPFIRVRKPSKPADPRMRAADVTKVQMTQTAKFCWSLSGIGEYMTDLLELLGWWDELISG
jgi:hypothetical protein